MTLDYLLQTAPSASSALWLLLISLINGPTVLPEEELSVSFKSPPGGEAAILLVNLGLGVSMVAERDPRPLSQVLPGGLGAPAQGRWLSRLQLPFRGLWSEA